MSSTGWAQFPSSIVSGSGTFVVRDARPKDWLAHPEPLSGRTTVHLEPAVLAISAERIRKSLYHELQVPEGGSDHIFLLLYPKPVLSSGVAIVSSALRETRHYHLAVADEIEPLQLIRGVVKVLLLELANRGQMNKSAEIPLWLSEGLAQELAAQSGPDLVFASIPPGFMLRSNRRVQAWETTEHLRQVLRSNPPISFNDLGMPSGALVSGARQQLFQSSSQLFVHELLRLRGGKNGLVTMLRRLPQCWNWQIAFLEGFQNEFHRPLDVEKWWALVYVEFTGRDSRQLLTRPASLQRMEEILNTPVEIRRASKSLPVRNVVPLGKLVLDWDSDRQTAALTRKVAQLSALRNNAPLELASLIEDYQHAIEWYLQQKKDSIFRSNAKRELVGYHRLLSQELARRVAELDKKRGEFQQKVAANDARSVPARPNP